MVRVWCLCWGHAVGFMANTVGLAQLAESLFVCGGLVVVVGLLVICIVVASILFFVVFVLLLIN